MSSDSSDTPARIRIYRRVEWMDTDAAGIYHWSTVIRFAEAAEMELHTALGIAEITFGATPRVKASFDFRRPLRFNDRATIDFSVQDVGRSSVRYRVALCDDEERSVAEGEVTTVFIDTDSGRSEPWPDAVRAALTGGGARQPAG
jgi:YbgC/YbaW family acyl-CoA thioester hydrolase